VTVLDASAVLALVHDEPGADLVQPTKFSSLGARNLAEVVEQVVDANLESARVRECSPPRVSRASR